MCFFVNLKISKIEYFSLGRMIVIIGLCNCHSMNYGFVDIDFCIFIFRVSFILYFTFLFSLYLHIFHKLILMINIWLFFLFYCWKTMVSSCFQIANQLIENRFQLSIFFLYLFSDLLLKWYFFRYFLQNTGTNKAE